MTADDRRRITLFDVMALIAATAAGLTVARWGWSGPSGNRLTGLIVSNSAPKGYPSVGWVEPWAARLAAVLPCLAAWTGAFLATRLHGPRPRRRRLARQPGLVGAVAVLSVLALESALVVGSAWLDGRFAGASPTRVAEFVDNAIILLAHHAGWAVAIAWLTLALSNIWRAEPSWVDRWGRMLGWTWIVIGPVAGLLVAQGVWWGRYFRP